MSAIEPLGNENQEGGSEAGVTFIASDARCIPLPDASVDVIVTSPP
jgi:ubiquinone/menaquinone biosynthesis C-methylase UbiE